LTHGGDVREDGYVVAHPCKKEFKHPVPSAGLSTSKVALSVSMEATGWPAFHRVSPARTFQVVKMQLSTD
jgi:hypothetical protein